MSLLPTCTEREYPKDRVVRIDLVVIQVGMQSLANDLFHGLPRGGSPLTEEPILRLGNLSLDERHTTYHILHII